MRSGAAYLASLEDERTVYVDGERIPRVAEHAAFRGIVKTVASLYEAACDPGSGMSHVASDTGLAAHKAFMIPRSREALTERRLALTSQAKLSQGLIGRGPEHVAGFLAGFASGPAVFARAGEQFGANVARFYRRAAADDLYVTYVIVPPQVDRSRTAHDQEEQFMQVGVCAERDGGIVVRGAQMLGTATAVSNYLLVSCIVPLGPGDEDYANTFVVPVGARGLRLYCRPPYALGRSSVFDYPLSTRFDETDALAVFDDVFVPWDDVFVYRNVELVRAQFFETAAHVLGNTQAQIRLAVKLRFLAGLARRIAKTTRVDTFPVVRDKLGELASLAAIVEGMVLAAESASTIDAFGVARPNPRYLYGAMGLQAEIYPRAVQILRELCGGAVVSVPSSYRELVSDETRDDIRRYVRSPGVPSDERIKLFKLAWELVGTEFAGRHQQYEMFYAGAPHVARRYALDNFGYDDAVELVDDFLAKYGVDTEKP